MPQTEIQPEKTLLCSQQGGSTGTVLCQAIGADSALLAALRQAAERPANASVRPNLSALLEVAQAIAGGAPRVG